MARPLRIEYPGAWYHVMNRGRRHESIFHDERDYELFLRILEQTCRLFNLEVHAFTLMPNHYHLLAQTPLGNLSRAMRHLNGVYTQKYNRRHGIDGGLFRGRYRSILIEEEAYLLELVRYIHRNAYKAGLEGDIGRYRWDSHRGYVTEQGRPEWLKTDVVLGKFSQYENEARIEMEAFVRKSVPDGLLKKLEGAKWPSVLGGKEFKDKIKKMIKGEELDKREISGYPEYSEHRIVDKDQFEVEINRIILAKKETMEKTRSKKLSGERRAIVYLLRQYGKTLREIGEYMGNVSYVSISRQYRQAEEEIKSEIGCYGELCVITEALKLQV